MSIYDFWGIEAEVDEAATKAWYETASPWGCNCAHCRNFLILAREGAMPKHLLELLHMLRIPPEKATYVCTLYPEQDGFCYQFSYRIAGRILREGAFLPAVQAWGKGWCTHEPYPYGAPDFPTPYFDLEFSLILPWRLEEPMDDPDKGTPSG